MRKLANIWIPIALLVVILTTVYFRQWILTARQIGQSRDAQDADVTRMMIARETIQDLSSLQLALRVKLFGPAAAEDAVLSAKSVTGASKALPSSVVSAMNRHAVRLVSYKQGDQEARIQFEGAYDNLVRFLEVTSPDMPRIDGFLMERGEKDLVKLTLTFGVSAV